jgi:hypothetical protein
MEDMNEAGERSEPHVRIFGQEVSRGEGSEEKAGDASRTEARAEHRAQRDEWRAKRREHREDMREWRRSYACYHRDHSGSFMGLLFIFGGMVLLLNSMDIISWEFWGAIQPLWPLLFVYLGLLIIAGHDPASHFIVFITGAVLCLWVILYGIVAVHSPLADALAPGLRQTVESFHMLHH